MKTKTKTEKKKKTQKPPLTITKIAELPTITRGWRFWQTGGVFFLSLKLHVTYARRESKACKKKNSVNAEEARLEIQSALRKCSCNWKLQQKPASNNCCIIMSAGGPAAAIPTTKKKTRTSEDPTSITESQHHSITASEHQNIRAPKHQKCRQIGPQSSAQSAIHHQRGQRTLGQRPMATSQFLASSISCVIAARLSGHLAKWLATLKENQFIA